MYLFRVKSPAESKGPWDYYTTVATVPATEAFQPLSKSTCPLVKTTAAAR
jgi:branched-chain amino acid transport system substrate-binding protein